MGEPARGHFKLAMSARSVSGASTISNRPWFLTHDPSCGEVFIWRNGCRLKLSENERAECVTEVSVVEEQDKTLLVSVCWGLR